jgi:hypothetical protein
MEKRIGFGSFQKVQNNFFVIVTIDSLVGEN